MKPFSLLILVALPIFFANPLVANDLELRQSKFNLKEKSVALYGFDPVSYFEETPKVGNESITFENSGVTYQFSSQANLEKFKTSPEKYEPQFGGWCAYALLDGDLVDVNPERYKIIEGKLYLFYDGIWGNTLKRWNKQANASSERTLVETAHNAWQEKYSK
ncbi:hypothetical protein MLD52_15680 [Puniceicoccaceae bacterium K14]|nr:hypothetical protein [Puniceicoccaceae bacterium K14]